MSTRLSFRFWPFLLASLLVLGSVGLLNWVIDPLWYDQGNRLSGKNFAFNERISKINLLNNTVHRNYDCLIIGSSRVVSLRPSAFQGKKCFNLALRGAEIPEMLAYARYARDLGLTFKWVYFGVDDFNFLIKKETERSSNPGTVKGTPSFWHAYFSADVLVFSLMTLANLSPDLDKYYDSQFEMKSFGPIRYQPAIGQHTFNLRCGPEKIQQFQEFRQIFPQAHLVAYAPAKSPWSLLDGIYLPGVLDCELDAFHAVAKSVDEFWDFGIPTVLTEDNANSSDGEHFTPESNDAIADQLQGRRHDLAINVKALSAEQYRAEVRTRLRAFLEKEDGMRWWRDAP